MRKTEYRPDIDGLRALAILPVVWFHSGLPGLPGGFTGVDTFFVISGFLIAGIIHGEVVEGRFSFARFYERRVRRIAPALLTVLLATLLVGSILLLPHELVKLGQSAIAALVMAPNFYFWQEAGYFRLGEGITPLLHTWSLGVEEQFYLLFPVFLIVAERLRIVKTALIVLAIGSFILCVVGTMVAPSAAFYLLPTRAWELMLGALLAVGAVRMPAKRATSIVGLGLLVVAAVAIQKGGHFPGWIAAIPAVGAMLLIGSGPDAPANRLLAHPSLVWIGKISYSLYLWHWPIFAFMRHYRADTELPAFWSLAGIALSVGLAWVSYVLIETPARQKTLAYRRVAAFASAGALVVVAGGIGGYLSAGIPARFSPQVLAMINQKDDLAPLAHKCVNTPLNQIDRDCLIGRGKAQVLIWGDSHAAAVSEGVAEAFEEPTVVAAMNSCAPSLGWTSPSLTGREPALCAKRNADLIERVLADPQIDTVVLVAYWPSHERSGGERLWSGTRELIARLPGKRVIVLAGTPEPGFNVPWASAIHARWGKPAPKWDCPRAIVPVGVEVADLSSAFCSYREPLRLFTDSNHPSLTANREVIAPGMRRATGLAAHQN